MLYILKKICKLLNWECYGKTAYGEKKGYIFTVFTRYNFIRFVVNLSGINDSDKEKLLSFLRYNEEYFRLYDYGFKDELFYFGIKYRSFGNLEYVKSSVDKITSFLLNNEICLNNRCSFCKQEDASDVYYVNNAYSRFHEVCFNLYLDAEKKTIEHEDSDKYYLFGILGSVFGGFLGIVFWLTLYGVLNSFFFVFSPILFVWIIRFLYYYMGGENGKRTKLIVSIVTIISVIVAFILQMILLLITLKFPISIEGISMLLEFDTVRDILSTQLVFISATTLISLFSKLNNNTQYNIVIAKKETVL